MRIFFCRSLHGPELHCFWEVITGSPRRVMLKCPNQGCSEGQLELQLTVWKAAWSTLMWHIRRLLKRIKDIPNLVPRCTYLSLLQPSLLLCKNSDVMVVTCWQKTYFQSLIAKHLGKNITYSFSSPTQHGVLYRDLSHMIFVKENSMKYFNMVVFEMWVEKMEDALWWA